MTRTKILLVDDDDDNLLTRKSLESQNCEVALATSVTEADGIDRMLPCNREGVFS